MEGRDNLSEVLQQRFQGHELPVDASVWDGISGQLAQAAASDPVSELFKERFSGHELPVDPALWQGIAAQMGHGAAVGTASGGLFSGAAGWVGGGIAAVAIVGAAYFAWPEPETNNAVATIPEQVERTAPNTEVPQQEVIDPTVPETDRTVSATTTNASAPVQQTLVPKPAPIQPTDPAPVASAQGTPGPNTEPAPNTRPDDTNGEETDPRSGDSIGPYIPTVNLILERTVEKTLQHPAPAEPEPSLPEAAANAANTAVEEEPDPFRTPVDDASIFIPNVFSPNSDRINDQLRAEGVDLENFQRVSVRIYSAANNQLVFSANDMSGWDGRDLSGQPCPDGYYFYALEAVTHQNRTITRGQTVRLFR